MKCGITGACVGGCSHLNVYVEERGRWWVSRFVILHLFLVRQCFLLDLELGWYPASARKPPVSSPSVTGITNACSHTWIFFFVWLLEFEFRSLSLNRKHSFLPTETSRQPHQVTTDVVSFFLTLGKIKVFHS